MRIVLFFCLVYLMLRYNLISCQVIENGDFEIIYQQSEKKNRYDRNSVHFWNSSSVSFNKKTKNCIHIDNESNFRVKARSGKAMSAHYYVEACPIGKNKLGCTNYLVAKTKNPLKVGSFYNIKYSVYLEEDVLFDTAGLSNIGLKFSTNEIKIPETGLIFADKLISNSLSFNKWIDVQIKIVPLCELNYICFGLFKNFEFPKLHRSIDHTLNFYFDNIEIVELKVDSINSAPFYYYDCVIKEIPNEIEIQDSINVFFSTNKFNIIESEKAKLINFMRINNSLSNLDIIEMTGSADITGDSLRNLKLSCDRVESVYKFLKEEVKVNNIIIKNCIGSKLALNTNATNLDRTVKMAITKGGLRMLIYDSVINYINLNDLFKAKNKLLQWITLSPEKNSILCIFDKRISNLMTIQTKRLVIKEIIKKYKKFKDPRKAYYWDSIYHEDQKFRYLDLNLANLGKEPYVNQYICSIDSLAYFDSLNSKKIFQEYNLTIPLISEIGEMHIKGFYFPLIHSNDSFLLNKYLADIYHLSKIGECTWEIYCTIFDKLCQLRHIHQWYGTQYVFTNDKKNELELYLIDDPKLVSIRRKQLGLHEINFDMNYKLRNR